MLARQMEVYAAFLEHTDHHVGRLVDAIDELGALDDTLVYVIIGDNGASAEGTINGAFNEMAQLQRHGRARDAGVHGVGARQVRLARVLQPLLGRLGARHEHALPVDEAGRLALGRHEERHDRALAEGDHRDGRGPQSVLPRDRRRADGPRGRRSAAADDGQRRHAGADRGHLDGLQLRRAGRAGTPRPAVLRDVRQPRRLLQGLERGDQAPHAVGDGQRGRSGVRRRRLGALRRHAGLDPVQRPRAGRCPTSSTSSSGCG